MFASRLLGSPLIHPVILVFAVLPFQWITLGKVGGFALTLPYASVLLLIAATLLSPRVMTVAASLLPRVAIWLVPYAFYLLILILMLHGSKAQGSPVRQVFYIVGFVGLGAWLAAARDVGRIARWAGAVSIVTFLLGTEILARGIGLSWATAITRFVTAGDLDFVIYKFFRAVFNALGDGEITVAASQKNTLAVTLLVSLQMFRAGRAPDRPDRVGLVVTGLVFFVLLMLNTRSVMLVAILSLPLLSVLTTLRARRHNLTEMILKATAAILVVAGLLVLLTSENSLVSMVERRFSFDDSSTGGRLTQYAWALQRIEQDFLTGSGYAEINGLPVHNIFLGAFMHAGLPAFLLVGVFYLGILISWLRFAIRIVLSPESWVLPMRAEWVALLPLVPLSRVWLAGDAGHPAIAEWVALACFFGLLLANQRQAVLAQTAEPGYSGHPVRLA